MYNTTEHSLLIAKYNVEYYNELFLAEVYTQAEVREELINLITEKREIYKPSDNISVRKLYRLSCYV